MIAEELKTKKTFYICSFCDKDYKNYNSLGNHNRKFHQKDNLVKVIHSNPNVIHSNPKVIQNNNHLNIEKSVMNTFNCIRCDKFYKYKQGLSKHKKTCKPKMDEINNLKQEEINLIEQQNLVKEEQKKLKEEQKKLKQEEINIKEEQKLIKLKLRLEKMDKIDSPTFNKVNKILKERSYKSNMMMNSCNTINSNSNNGYSVVNNYNNPIFQLGTENVSSVLTLAEKKLILEQKDFCLDKMVEIVHCGAKYHQFKNIVVTNVKDEYAYTYNADAGYFIKSKMDDTINDLISYRIKDIEEIYNELKDMDKVLEKRFQYLIKSFLEEIKDIGPEDTYENPDTSEKYKNICEYKIESLKIFIYNNQDKITKDILLLIQ